MKVLLADDHVLFREGLRMVLEHLVGGDLEIIEAGNFGQALTSARQNPDFDLALVDLFMPEMDGGAGVQALKRLMPNLAIVVLSASEDSRDVARVMEAGAQGYIAKSSGSDILMDGIRRVLDGARVILPEHITPEAGETGGAIRPPLTPRQVDVLLMLAKGKSNKEIARELNLAEITVKLHVTAILKALEVDNRTQAAIAATRYGIGAY